jgi:hypothetical protein
MSPLVGRRQKTPVLRREVTALRAVLVDDAGTEHYHDKQVMDKFRATVPEFGQS